MTNYTSEDREPKGSQKKLRRWPGYVRGRNKFHKMLMKVTGTVFGKEKTLDVS